MALLIVRLLCECSSVLSGQVFFFFFTDAIQGWLSEGKRYQEHFTTLQLWPHINFK